MAAEMTLAVWGNVAGWGPTCAVRQETGLRVVRVRSTTWNNAALRMSNRLRTSDYLIQRLLGNAMTGDFFFFKLYSFARLVGSVAGRWTPGASLAPGTARRLLPPICSTSHEYWNIVNASRLVDETKNSGFRLMSV